MLANVMYILPMLLGRTFDARHDRVGIDIFPQSELERARVLKEPESISRYEIADSSEEVRNLLEVSGDLALKVKAGKLDLKGTGTYLKDTSKTGRNIEILTRLKFKTITVVLPSEVQPFPDWSLKHTSDLGTHYVRSVSYGGELLASIRFRTNRDVDFNAVNALVKGTFTGGDAVSLVVEGKLENIQSRLKDQASMEISYYATVPLKGVANTIEGLRQLVKDFDKHVLEVNNGWGVPIRVELMELDSLPQKNGTRFPFLQNKALEAVLSDLELEFDDLRTSSARLTEWLRSLPATISPEQEEQIKNLYKRIQSVLRPYYDAIGHMNVEDGPGQLDAAKEAYREGKSGLPGKFGKELARLMKKIVIVERKLYGTGTSTYVRWGSLDCPPSPMTTRLISGYAAASTNRGTGGGSEYLCLPAEPKDSTEEAPPFGSDQSTFMAGVRYGPLDEGPFDGDNVRHFFGHGVPCATCHATNRTLVTIFPAVDRCPTDNFNDDGVSDWILEYSGYLVSGGNLPGLYACVDSTPENHDSVSDEQQTHSMAPVPLGDGTLPRDAYDKKGAALSCVVCSK